MKLFKYFNKNNDQFKITINFEQITFDEETLFEKSQRRLVAELI